MTDARPGPMGQGQPDRPLDELVEELRLRLDRLQARLDAHEALEADGARWVAAELAAAQATPTPLPPPTPLSAASTGWIPGWGQWASQATPAAPTTRPDAGSGGRLKPPAGPLITRVALSDLEERLTGRVLAWVGGIALIAGAILFLSLAFSRGWIGPEARVLLGLTVGLFALGFGAWLFEEARQREVAHVLVAVGLGILSLALIAATRLYDLIPVDIGLAGSLLLAIAAAVIAIRANSQTVAGFGLLAVLAAPPLMGASPDLATVAFLGTALVGTTIVALFRSWSRLPLIAFVLSAPQLAKWLTSPDVDVAIGLTVLALFWLINVIAAAGEEMRRRRRVLQPSTAILIVADAAFAVAAGFALLDGPFEIYRGAFLALLALAHFAIGAWFLRAEGDDHLFGLLVSGTGLAALTIAVLVQFGAPVVPIAWAAEALALAWIRVRRDHFYSGVAAVALWGLAVVHLLLIEFPPGHLSGAIRQDVPFTDPAGLAAVFVIGSFIVGGWFLAVRRERAPALAVAVLLAVYVLPFEVSAIVVLVGWALLGVGAIGVDRRVLPGRRPWPRNDAPAGAWLEWSLWCAGAVAFAGALVHAVLVELPLTDLYPAELPTVPFLDAGGLTIVVLATSALAIAAIDRRPVIRVLGGLIAGAVVAYGVIFELPLDSVVVVWSGLAVVYASVAADGRDEAPWWLAASDAFIVLGASAVLIGLAPLDRLVVDADRTRAVVPFVNGGTIALGSVVAALAISARLLPSQRWTPIRVGAAAIASLYLLSVGVVDIFQARVGGAVGDEELTKQGQVALSALWAVLGAAAFAVGLGADRPRARQAGLALLGVVTVKVFLVDLASLDVAYRVLSLVALGIVLLLSAYLFGRFGPSRARQ